MNPQQPGNTPQRPGIPQKPVARPPAPPSGLPRPVAKPVQPLPGAAPGVAVRPLSPPAAVPVAVAQAAEAIPVATAVPELAVASTPSRTELPTASPIAQELIKGKFLLEGAAAIGGSKVAFVNIYNGKALDPEGKSAEKSSVYTLDLANGDLREIILPRGHCATAVLPTTDPDSLLVVTNQGIFTLNHSAKNKDWELTLWHKPKFMDEWPAGSRPNDCRVDPEGNLLISMMGEGPHRAAAGSRQGELYLVRPDKSETLLLSGLFIPNGNVCIPRADGSYTMLYNDTARSFSQNEAVRSLPRAVDSYHYDPKAGTLLREGEFYIFEGGNDVQIFPDGMAVSADHKFVFVPMFKGGGVEVLRVNEAGKGERVGLIQTPGAEQCTSIAILADGNAIITTAAEFYGPLDHVRCPNAGSIFYAELGVYPGVSGASPALFDLQK